MAEPTDPLAPLRPTVPRAPLRTARFYEWLPAEPREHTVATAAAYHALIVPMLGLDEAMQVRFQPALTHHERRNLQRLERRWRRRRDGEDLRWLLFGAKRGRLAKEDEEKYRRPDPEWSDPTWRP